MSVTIRFVLLAAAGLLFVAGGWVLGLQAYVFVIYNLLLAGFLALDFLISPKPDMLTVRRTGDEKLYFKTENEMLFYVQNLSRHTLKVQAKDEIGGAEGRHFTITGECLDKVIIPRDEAAFSYTVVPSKRGSFLFTHIHLRYGGLLGLCVKYVKVPCPFDYKVYPNLKDLSLYRLMIQKNRLLPRGEKTVRLYGMGAEFESLRHYVEGDDYRKMNWMATARENRLIVNRYQEEKNQPVFMLLDTGRPMSYTVGGYKKLDYAINAALILSDIVNRQGDQSGLISFDASVKTQIMPGKGAAHRNRLMEALYHVEDNRLTSDYEGAFRMLCERQKRRALVFIFTDFEIWEEAESLTAHIALLKKRHRPVVVFMKNESLNALAEQAVWGEKDRCLKETALAFLQERQLIFRRLNALGIPNVESPAEAFATEAVNRYLSLRARQAY